MRKSNRKNIDPKIKKLRKIIWIILGSFVGLMVALVILGAIVSGGGTDDLSAGKTAGADESSEASTSQPAETSSTEQAKATNATREALSKLVGDLTAYQVNASSDFELASKAIDTTTGEFDTDAMAIYKKDFDSMLEKVKALDASTDNLVNTDDLSDPDNKLFIDSQVQGIVNDLLGVLAIGSTTLGHAVDGSMSDQDITDLNSATTLMDGLNSTIRALSGIHDNEENWK